MRPKMTYQFLSAFSSDVWQLIVLSIASQACHLYVVWNMLAFTSLTKNGFNMALYEIHHVIYMVR